jgi:hypothetical protein
MRGDLLNCEIFYALKEAKTAIEARRRPRSSLGYRPPAPQATVWSPDQQFINRMAPTPSLN